MRAQVKMQSMLSRRGFLGLLTSILGSPLASSANSGGHNATNQSQAPYHRTGIDSYVAPEQIPWQRNPRLPILDSKKSHEALFIEAIDRNEALYGGYNRWGDSTIRRISPIQLFQVESEDLIDRESDVNPHLYQNVMESGPAYLLAWDHDRHASRTFRAEYFVPLLTAPWMQRYAGEMSPAKWEQTLQRIENQLRQLGVQPVTSHA